MDVGTDFTFLADEKFDFDISLSPSSAKDTEDCDDEVFIGPVEHKEKCVLAAIQLHESDKKTPSDDQAIWSPLSGDKFVEIFKEAHLLALQLGCSTNDDRKEEPLQPIPNPAVEKFVQESKSKLKLFDAFNGVDKTPVAIKRETYCIQDSPLQQLPPSVQQQTMRPNKHIERTEAQKSQILTSPLKAPKVVKSLSVSPLIQKAKAPQAKTTVPPLGTGKIVSRLQPMKAATAQLKNSTLTVEKLKTTKKQSPVRRKNLSSMGSTEDLLSGNSSITSDISDSSFNNSSIGQSKRTLVLPSKLNLGKTQFKTPSAAPGSWRNTSSSSSSHSSINTSLNSSLSSPPAASAKLNASLHTSLNTSINGSRLKPNTSRFALVRPLGGIGSTLKVANSDSSNHRLKPNAATKANGNKPASLSMAQPQTPTGKVHRQTSAPNLHRLPPSAKPESEVKKLSTKPQARILPTPTSRLKPPQKPDGQSPDHTARRCLKPTRLLSCGDIGSGPVQSTPIGSKGMQMNSSLIGRCISATPTSKLSSALPTSVSRRTSGMFTPRTVPRAIPSFRPAPALQASSKSSRKLPVGSECEQVKPKLSLSPSSPNEDNTIPPEICCSLNFSPENKLVSDEQRVVALPSCIEDLLIDIEVEKTNPKIRKPSSIDDSQPLIDLSNTPELNKQLMQLIPLKPMSVSQLIDLSSPLIKLSPEANKENMNSPLLKF